jgi:hypothetical protein
MALERPLSPALLTEALRSLTAVEAEALARLLASSCFLGCLAQHTSVEQPLTEAALDRVCRWLEALCDAQYTALVLHAHSNERLQELLEDLRRLCALCATQAQVCEDTLGLWIYLCTTRFTPVQRAHDDYRVEVMFL